MNPKPITLAKDPWLAAALSALHRARQRAEEIALQTGTPLVVARDGRTVMVEPGVTTHEEPHAAR